MRCRDDMSSFAGRGLLCLESRGFSPQFLDDGLGCISIAQSRAARVTSVGQEGLLASPETMIGREVQWTHTARVSGFAPCSIIPTQMDSACLSSPAE